MKRKPSKPNRKQRPRNKKHSPKTRGARRSRRRNRLWRPSLIPLTQRELSAQARAFRVLGMVRRGVATLTKAARQERIKPETVLRYVGKALYRSGHGKPWKARPADQLAASMTVLTTRGPLTVVVRNSRERKLLGRYDAALRRFRAGEDGAEAGLRQFDGRKVGGQTLITDTKLVIQLEEAGQLDFDTLYTSLGAGS
jgi:hypothetical protein